MHMALNTALFKRTANFPHLQDGNLGPDPIPTEVSEKTSINVNGHWKRALILFFLMHPKFAFQQIVFLLL